MTRTRFHTLAPLAALFLTACGGGGSSGGDVPANDSPSLSPVNQPSPEPIAQPMPQPAPVSDGPLSALYGRVLIAYSFTNTTDNVFTASATFGPENVIEPASGGAPLLLAPDARGTGQVDGADTMTSRAMPLTCAESADRVLCTIDAAGPSRVVLVFDELPDGGYGGTFEFCGLEPTTRECITRLLSTPDGVAAMTITQGAAKLAASGDADLAPYLAYEQQGVPAATPTAVDVSLLDALAPALDAMGAAVAP